MNIQKQLRDKTKVKITKNFDQEFWAKFDSEFAEEKVGFSFYKYATGIVVCFSFIVIGYFGAISTSPTSNEVITVSDIVSEYFMQPSVYESESYEHTEETFDYTEYIL